MPDPITISLARQIVSVTTMDSFRDVMESGLSNDNETAGSVPHINTNQTRLVRDLEKQRNELSNTCQILKDLIDKFNQFCEKIFAEQKEEIAKLSVEISRKVLMQKVQEGDYKIESIIKETLENAPTRKDIVVHLNPEDFVQCEKLKQNETGAFLAGIKFISDPGIGRAECLLETPKGAIESLIEEHLERIGKALEKVD